MRLFVATILLLVSSTAQAQTVGFQALMVSGTAVIGNLADVSATTPTNKQLMTWDSATNSWQPSSEISATTVTSSGFLATGVAGGAGVDNSSGGTDNLGDHTATQDLNLDSNSITNAANITASNKITSKEVQVSNGTDTMGSSCTSDRAGTIVWDATNEVMIVCHKISD